MSFSLLVSNATSAQLRPRHKPGWAFWQPWQRSSQIVRSTRTFASPRSDHGSVAQCPASLGLSSWSGGLQVVEQWNSANGYIFYGKDSELTGADRDSHETSMLALHLLQSALVNLNTLPIQRVLAGTGTPGSAMLTGGA
jgi:Tn3 transposase DDE domain